MKNYLLATIILVFFFNFSLQLVNTFNETDFPSFYRAAKTITDPDASISQIYITSDPYNKYNIPERFMYYRYSIPATVLLSPLALLPYKQAKLLFILVDSLCYLSSVLIILKLLKTPSSLMLRLLFLSLLWPPLYYDLKQGQLNGAILFLITVACLTAIRNRIAVCGVLIGVAALFKIFPIAIAMVLGIKNWRIFAWSLLVFSTAFIFPDPWMQSLGNPPIDEIWHSLAIKILGLKYFIVFSGTVAIVTAYTALRSRQLDYPPLFALGIAGMLMANPYHEYYYLTMLVFPLLYMALLPGLRFMAAVSCVIIFTALTIPATMFFGVTVIWVSLVLSFRLRLGDPEVIAGHKPGN